MQIFDFRFSMDLHVLRSPESENHIFDARSVCMCVCGSVCLSVCVYVCVCVSVISIAQKQITAETSNLVFYIYIISRCYLKHFLMVGEKPCVQGYTKEFEYIKAYGGNFVLVNFRIFRQR